MANRKWGRDFGWERIEKMCRGMAMEKENCFKMGNCDLSDPQGEESP
jgi:hypothetical protein